MAKSNVIKQNEEPISSVKFLDIAKKAGVDSDYFFKTTLARYRFLCQVLTNLKKAIKEEGVIVKKEYVKNRKNIYTHPAISEYDKTAAAANSTAAALISIIEKAAKISGKTDDETDEFLEKLKTK